MKLPLLPLLISLLSLCTVQAAENQKTVYAFNTIYDLVAYGNPVSQKGNIVLVGGYTNIYDGYGGIFTATNTVTSTNTSTRIYSGVSGWSWERLVYFISSSINPSSGFLPYNNGGLFADSAWRMVSGNAKATNASGSSLLVDLSSATQPTLTLANNAGYTLSLAHSGGGVTTVSSVGSLFVGASGKNLGFLTGGIIPNTSGGTAYALGANAVGQAFSELWTENAWYQYSTTISSTINYERLMIDHLGSSGVVFDSQKGGTGTARDFVFQAESSQIAKLNTFGELSLRKAAAFSDGAWLFLEQRGNGASASNPAGNGSSLGGIQWHSWNGSAYSTGPSIQAFATETLSGSANGSKSVFYAITNGTTVSTEIASVTSAGFVIGSGGTAIAKVLSATAALNFGNTSAQSSADLTITVTGAATGDVVNLGVPTASVLANSSFTAWVSAADTVTVRFNNYSSGAQDPNSGTFRVQVNKF